MKKTGKIGKKIVKRYKDEVAAEEMLYRLILILLRSTAADRDG